MNRPLSQQSRNNLEDCHEDVKFDRQLRQEFNLVEAISVSRRCRHERDGDFLCGPFSLADCFYAPVAFRFQTYGVEPKGEASAYLESLLAHSFVREWETAGLAEKTIIELDEPRVVYRDKLAAAARQT